MQLLLFSLCICTVHCYMNTPFRAFKTNLNRLQAILGTNNGEDQLSYAEALINGSKDITRRFFFPGHGGKGPLHYSHNIQNIEALDLPELDETDNIHSPEGPLLRALQRTAKLYHAHRSWFLVNGSTSGILAAILSLRQIFLARRNSQSNLSPVLLVPRDSHKAVYDALSIFEIDAVLIDVQTDQNWNINLGVNTDAVQSAILEYGDRIMGLVLTRPSYQGVLLHSDILRQLIQDCHQQLIPVLVDEAHGAHLRFLPEQYQIADALSSGADIVIQSAHKTLNSLSQTALMHLHSDAFSCFSSNDPAALSLHDIEDIVHNAFSALTTTSPNSLLLASLDATIDYYQTYGLETLQQQCNHVANLKQRLRNEASDIIHLLDDKLKNMTENMNPHSRYQVDPVRLSIHIPRRTNGGSDCDHWDSVSFDDYLCEEYGIYCELNLPDCVTYILPTTAAANSDANNGDAKHALLETLGDAMIHTAQLIRESRSSYSDGKDFEPRRDSTIVRSGHAFVAHWQSAWQRRLVPLPITISVNRDAANGCTSIANEALLGCISGETISVYPPGIPFLVRGERIQKHHLHHLCQLHRALVTPQRSSHTENVVIAEEIAYVLASGQRVTGNKDALLSQIMVLPPYSEL